MSTSLAFLRSKRRTEAVDLAEGHRRGFAVKLPALGQVSFVAEILRLEKRRRAFAGRWGENRRIDVSESVFVKEIVNGFHETSADFQDRVGPIASQPQMAVRK